MVLVIALRAISCQSPYDIFSRFALSPYPIRTYVYAIIPVFFEGKRDGSLAGMIRRGNEFFECGNQRPSIQVLVRRNFVKSCIWRLDREKMCA
jgi:hypothetical protein